MTQIPPPPPAFSELNEHLTSLERAFTKGRVAGGRSRLLGVGPSAGPPNYARPRLHTN